ncbi:uncharacterized protein N7473_008751 [Penicillium subrubescens]|uniref:Zn(2)-C6 fungal-type domain-containing protein n=1 Tax=Penicillium subrubescens TaxID=1316194 RepID=A0A1Q5UCJ2_9EURO|nr:uncharacterized protein N7473_008751 [Penicillium subrubescens]KAJ5886077.1 hypothetical protein N7473_008751 [Penicillium subrubescens]OKP10183.1 hypothetical protein PENSUB_4357 [Penicillium subrubescens]
MLWRSTLNQYQTNASVAAFSKFSKFTSLRWNLDSVTPYHHSRHYPFITFTLPSIPSISKHFNQDGAGPLHATPSRGGPLRRPVCGECKIVKRRCSRDRPSCSRCEAQGKEFRYPDDSDPRAENPSSIADTNLDTPAPSIVAFSAPSPSITPTLPVNRRLSSLSQSAPSQNAPTDNTPTQQTLHFENVSLLPMLDAEEIRDR